jgi:2-polyprenyl-6-methoxyphenol hydroxylase-like FAD-dependent oxidoreductase
MRVLISGAGVAGPCLAFWLRRHGFDVTIVERAPRLRAGGYIVDFWGAGFDVAERMGLAPEILRKGYQMKELRQVDRDGNRVSGFGVSAFEALTGGRFTSLPRSELAASIYGALDDRVETIFDDGIAALEDAGSEVRVQLGGGARRTFDLVIGADGLHSQVRRLVFGEESQFERYLGLKVAAFAVAGFRPRAELVYVIHSDLERQMGRFAMRDDQTMFLLTFADASPEIPDDLGAQKALLAAKFAGAGDEVAKMREALQAADGLYIDRVSQIRMDRWWRGRVALVGDAAFCVSLLGGQGSALAMVAAYILAGELKRANGDPEVAFAQYQQRLGAFLASKQKAAVRVAPFFAPRSRLGLFVRYQAMKLMGLPFVAELAFGRGFKDRLALPDY